MLAVTEYVIDFDEAISELRKHIVFNISIMAGFPKVQNDVRDATFHSACSHVVICR